MGLKSKIRNHYFEKSRLNKFNQFMECCCPTDSDKVLDVGVQNAEFRRMDNIFVKKYPYKSNLTGLSVEELGDFSKRYPEVKSIVYDGKIFPFNNSTFDLLWSNAVVEHLADYERQEFFISEMIRVTKRKALFTTPNRAFPIELHTRFPFIHWLPKRMANWLYIKCGKEWATKDYINLLYERDIVQLLEKLKNKYSFNYKIMRNRLFGFTCTFSVLIMLEE